MKRRIILRPLPELNDGFTGSNPDFNPFWDGTAVDLDGDGVRTPVGRRQRRRRRAGQHLGGLGHARALDQGRPALQAAVRHPLRRPRRPAQPQRPRLPRADATPGTRPDDSSRTRFSRAGPARCRRRAARAAARPTINLNALFADNLTPDPEYSDCLTGNGSGRRGRDGGSIRRVPGRAGPGLDPLSLNLLADYPDNWNLCGHGFDDERWPTAARWT